MDYSRTCRSANKKAVSMMPTAFPDPLSLGEFLIATGPANATLRALPLLNGAEQNARGHGKTPIQKCLDVHAEIDSDLLDERIEVLAIFTDRLTLDRSHKVLRDHLAKGRKSTDDRHHCVVLVDDADILIVGVHDDPLILD